MPLRSPAGFISAFFDPLKNPNAPTIGTATAGDASAEVAFTAPANVGGSAITAYYAVSNPDQVTVSGASSPITVTGLTNSTSYTFSVWALNSYGPGAFSAASNSVTPLANPDRGIISGGRDNSGFAATSIISYLTISSSGNTSTFGSLTRARNYSVSCSSSTRAIIGANASTTDYITIATTGNAVSFGAPFYSTDGAMGCGNSTRGLYGGGDNYSPTNVIQYCTIATTGSWLDFGDLATATSLGGGASSPTRALFIGGVVGGMSSIIQYVTIATTGNSTSFGNLTVGGRYESSACSNATYAIMWNSPNADRITIATTGNSTSWGSTSGFYLSHNAACSNATRALLTGGYTGTAISYQLFASSSASVSFGDLVANTLDMSGCSSVHGGLS
jgi:hypothetical protein